MQLQQLPRAEERYCTAVEVLRFEPAEVAVVVAVAETQLLSAESRPALSALWVSRQPFEDFEVAAAESELFAELLNAGYHAEHVARDGCVFVVVKLEHRYEFDVVAELSAVAEMSAAAEFGPAAAERSAELAEQPAERRQPELPVDCSVPSMG